MLTVEEPRYVFHDEETDGVPGVELADDIGVVEKQLAPGVIAGLVDVGTRKSLARGTANNPDWLRVRVVVFP